MQDLKERYLLIKLGQKTKGISIFGKSILSSLTVLDPEEIFRAIVDQAADHGEEVELEIGNQLLTEIKQFYAERTKKSY